MNLKQNIRRIIFAVVAVVAFMPAVQAQELVGCKRGSVREQLAQLPMYQDNSYEQVMELLNYAYTFLGTKYRIGSSSPKGFDCSGFTSYVFKQFGYDLNRTSGMQVSNGVPVAKNELRPGDLVFFNGRAVGKRIGHVGIVTEVKDDGQFEFIHSCNSKGVTVSSSEETYYKRRYVKASRVIYDEQCKKPSDDE